MHAPLLAALATALLVASPAPQGQQAPQGQEKPPEKPYKVGWPIRDELVLQDLAREEHLLFDEHEGEVLVLVFWSLKDPASRVYEKRLSALQAELAEEDVTVLLVESNHDELVHPTLDPLQRIRDFVEEAELELPILLDPENRLADDFEALCANHAFVIDARRYLRYSGAIDDDPKGERKPEDVTTWLADALAAVLEGKLPEVPLTRPKGRRIQKAPKAG